MNSVVRRRKPRFSKKKNRRTQLPEPRRFEGIVAGVKRWLLRTLVVSLLAGSTVGAFVGWQTLHTSARLRVQQVIVEGIQRISREEMDLYLGDVVGKSIFDLELDAYALELKRHPWIEDVVVRRRLPTTLMVVVSEYEPSLLVSLGEIYIANEQGLLFKHFSGRDGLVLPVLTGMDVDVSELDLPESRRIVMNAIEIAGEIEKQKNVFGRVEEIHFDLQLGWSIVSRPPQSKGGILRTHLGVSAIRRMAVAKDVLIQLKRMNRDPEVVWADGVKNPDRVHVRLRQARSTNDVDGLVASAR